MEILLVRLLLVCTSLTVVVSNIPNVRLGDTIITGFKMTSFHGRDIDAFQNIPYAEPPIGELRFKPTVPLIKLPRFINASSNDVVSCKQVDFITFSKDAIGSEDCLILNVYTPTQRQSEKPLPVAVYIHGGAFTLLYANSILFGPKKLLEHDMILVTMNYRLGVLGFLSTGDDASPGNYGIWDILTSLQWVKNNIRDFGGNPNDVTLFGQSSGAMTISLLLVSPLAKGLFHKAILESGSMFIRRMFSLNPLQEAQSLADSFWCPVTPTEAMVDCLRNQSANQLILSAFTLPMQKATTIFPRFVPVIDKHILLEHPIALYSKGLFHRIPIITGVNMNEGLLFYFLMYEVERRYYENEDTFWEKNKYKIIDSMATTQEGEKFLFQEIEKIYLKGLNKSDFIAMRETLSRCFTDVMFNAPTVKFVNYVSKFSSTYLYNFNYKGSFAFVDIFSLFDSYFHDNTSVIHNEEVPYIFSTPLDHLKKPKQEIEFEAKFLNLWSNFIIYGKPTPNGTPIEWEPVKTPQLEYLSIGKQIRMQKGFQNDEVQYINEVILPCLNKLEEDIFALSGPTTYLDTNCNFSFTKENQGFNKSKSMKTITFQISQKFWYLTVLIFLIVTTIMFFTFIIAQYYCVMADVPSIKYI